MANHLSGSIYKIKSDIYKKHQQQKKENFENKISNLNSDDKKYNRIYPTIHFGLNKGENSKKGE